MRFVYGKQDMQNLQQAQDKCWLLTNGLGGYSSLSACGSVTRGDQGILIAAAVAPTLRYTLVQRLRERAILGDKTIYFSTQDFAGQQEAEEGYRHLTRLVWDQYPHWIYENQGLCLEKEIFMKPGANRVVISYRVTNFSGKTCHLRVAPGFLGLAKGQTRLQEAPYSWTHVPASPGWHMGCFSCGHGQVYLGTNGDLEDISPEWETLHYRDDVKDGREACGMNLLCAEMVLKVSDGKTGSLQIQLGDGVLDPEAEDIRGAFLAWQEELEDKVPLRHPVARQLAMSGDAFISRRDSIGEMTILAGYPFFTDWGRDTMISLPGCVMSAGRWDLVASILKTFLAYEKDGLIPNLFPEGDQAPRYNTVDASLLLFQVVWLYMEEKDDREFLAYAFPVMERIIEGYRKGTHHGIHMDRDGLIEAGAGLDQVTWMDVCVDGILPTPRHGKPVEVNAYWYNALMVMASLAARVGKDGSRYEKMAELTRTSFLQQFWMEEAGYLKDLVSGTPADEEIRCNQIWAVTMAFTMLSPDQERCLVETVYRELYTPCGLRTLSPGDPHFHPTYGGDQLARDLAYHQGTVWVFPLGAFYQAWLKVHRYSMEAVAWVRDRLDAVEAMLREGCMGQLPEIYYGLCPGPSCGCFAQAWSVGEILRVYQLLEQVEDLHRGKMS